MSEIKTYSKMTGREKRIKERKRGTSTVPSMAHFFQTEEAPIKERRLKTVSRSPADTKVSINSIDSGVISQEDKNRDDNLFVLPPLGTLNSLSTKRQTISAYLQRQPEKQPASIESWLESVQVFRSDDITDPSSIPMLPKISTTRQASVCTSVQEGPSEDVSTPLIFVPKTHSRDPIQAYNKICKQQRVTPVDRFIKQIGQPSIDLRNHLLGSTDIRAIAITLAKQKKTLKLDISGNNIGPVGTSYLAEALQTISQLEVLVMSATLPDVRGCQRLCETLRYNDCLKILNLGENQLSGQHAVHLAAFMKVTRTLRELYLNHNKLDEAGGRLIGAALARNRSIHTLDLTWNHLRRGGAVAICKALEVNSTLEKLNVSWNGFSVEGCKCLSRVLPKNDTLRHLNLSSNRINPRALLFFLKGLVKNEGITSLQIGKNPLTTDAAILVIETLTACDFCSIDDLDLSDVPVDEVFLEAVEKLREKRIVSLRHGPFYRQEELKQGEQSKTLGLERFDPVLILYEYMKLDSMRLVDMFHYFDTDQNGYISISELRDGFLNANIPLTEDGLEQLLKKIDTDSNGKIDLQEMMAGHRKFSRSVAERNRIAKLNHKTEDRSLKELRKIIKKFLNERNEKLKETKSDTEGRVSSKSVNKISGSDSQKTRRLSRRSRVSVHRLTGLPTSITEEKENDIPA